MKMINKLYKMITVTGPLGIIVITVGSVAHLENLTLAGVLLFMASITTGFVLLGIERQIEKNKEREGNE